MPITLNSGVLGVIFRLLIPELYVHSSMGSRRPELPPVAVAIFSLQRRFHQRLRGVFARYPASIVNAVLLHVNGELFTGTPVVVFIVTLRRSKESSLTDSSGHSQ